jgi:hypothetical protein
MPSGWPGNQREHVDRLLGAVRELATRGPRRRWQRDADGT